MSLAITDLSYTVTTVINGCIRTVSVAYSGIYNYKCFIYVCNADEEDEDENDGDNELFFL